MTTVEQMAEQRAANWKPSKRAMEAVAAMWSAFEQGDRWLRCEQASTARYTVESLRWHGYVEVDPEDKRRFRISEDYLNQNGLTRATRFFAGITLSQVYDIQDAIELQERSAA